MLNKEFLPKEKIAFIQFLSKNVLLQVIEILPHDKLHCTME